MYFYFHIVHLKGCKCAIAICPITGKYRTLSYRQVTANRLLISSVLSFASTTIAELKARYMHYTITFEAKSCCHYHSVLPSLPLTIGKSLVSRSQIAFSAVYAQVILSFTQATITMALPRCAFVINYTYTSKINQLKHRFASAIQKNNTWAWSRA